MGRKLVLPLFTAFIKCRSIHHFDFLTSHHFNTKIEGTFFSFPLIRATIPLRSNHFTEREAIY